MIHRRQEERAPAKPFPNYVTISAKLDFLLTAAKSITSQFLIDNFRAVLPLAAPKQLVAKAGPAPSLKLRASRGANRQYPELESPVSHRKQTTENFLIAKFRPMSRPPKQPAAAISKVLPNHALALARHSSLACAERTQGDTRHCLLIANETHSHTKPSSSKTSTYEFLIANEFHFHKSPFRPFLAPANSASGICFSDCMTRGMVYVMPARRCDPEGRLGVHARRSKSASEEQSA